MIQFLCPGCESKLNAKDELAGQSRKCPKCGYEVRIPSPPEPERQPPAPAPEVDEFQSPDGGEVVASSQIHFIQEGLPQPKTPKHLNRENRYLICDLASVFAVWSDTSGWMIRTNAGLASAARNPDMLPSEGNYVLVELLMSPQGDGNHVTGIDCHKLNPHYALLVLADDEEKILSKVTGPGSLNRTQKMAVLRWMKENFMPEVWGEFAERPRLSHERLEVVPHPQPEVFLVAVVKLVLFAHTGRVLHSHA